MNKCRLGSSSQRCAGPTSSLGAKKPAKPAAEERRQQPKVPKVKKAPPVKALRAEGGEREPKVKRFRRRRSARAETPGGEGSGRHCKIVRPHAPRST